MSRTHLVTALVVVLLATQGGLLAYSATQHSPTLLEPAQLAAGISNWQFRQFDLFRVNPPLVRMIAALPVLAVGCETDWRGFYYYGSPGGRPEFAVGSDFIAANGPRSIWLFTLARWVCIPVTLLGGMFCFLWAMELYGRAGCGLLALTLWCFEPNILGHGELIATDAAATTFGIGAAYSFWRWLKQPNWGRASVAGLLLGLAQLAKMSWLFLFILWPLLWLFWRLTSPHTHCNPKRERGTEAVDPGLSSSFVPAAGVPSIAQLVGVVLLGMYVLNLGYAFEGTGTRLKDFTFVSRTLTGHETAGLPGNRFTASSLGSLPVPLPIQYMLGLDAQRRDFEDYRGEPSYLRGEWKRGGWWYYYLYALAVKTPHGHQILFGMAVLGVLWRLVRGQANAERWRDAAVLWAPPLQLLGIVSAQLEFNHYVRYVLPVIGFATVAAGAAWPAKRLHECSPLAPRADRLAQDLEFRFLRPAARGASRLHCLRVLAVVGPVAWSVFALASNYPHQLVYFNEAAGGPRNGYRHLLYDAVDYGQDLFFAERLRASLGNSNDTHTLYLGAYRADSLGVVTNTPVTLPLSPGMYLVSATILVASKQRRALGGPDPQGPLVAELSRYPFRRIEGCAMLVVTVPSSSKEGEPP